ncbi:FAD-binding oxidoreductase [Bacteroidia bacterium]|nr:FAD-binding oxidoreductase [Bacteroidia bacterium]MDB4107018.1 FAD-binding oxidoreductase [Bacteroidia bacterium]MDB9882477.1 FAD-binding oxidoreductase [Bacteroidia bacterium]
MHNVYWEKEHLLSKIDYLIVGMGLVGLQTAINLKEAEPKAKVVVIDRHAWSLGASTRNAGFGCFANVSEILDDLQNDTPDNVYGNIKKRYLGLQKLRTKFGDKNLDYAEKGSVEIFTQENKTHLNNGIDSLQGINTILYNELGLDNVFSYKSNNALPNTIGAIHNAFEGQLHTGKLYETVHSFAQDIGIKLYGGIEVKSWIGGDIIEIDTHDGLKIVTKKLILCTNAFTSKLMDADILPARGQVILSERVAQLPCEGLHMFDSGYYYWRDIDNRILLGGARNLDKEEETSYKLDTNTTIVDELKRFMNEQIFGREVFIEYQWSGIMAMGKGETQQKTPIVKEVEPNIYMAARLGGMGVALSANVADELVKTALSSV